VAVSLLAFGAYTYFSVYSDLHSNLDASLQRVASSLDMVVKEEQEKLADARTRTIKKNKDKFSLFRESELMRFVGPIRPGLIEPSEEDEPDIVWTAVYQHILMNPKNYYIQVADTSLKIVWRSKNIANDSLPILISGNMGNTIDSIDYPGKDSLAYVEFDNLENEKNDIFSDTEINGQSVRLLVKRTDNAIYSIGYIMSDIELTMNKLFAIQIIAFPFILIISVIGGLFLSKFSLRTIDDITVTADEITAKNLSRRIPELQTKDEIGHLIKTINQMIERLEHSFNQIRKFTSDVSHELRTPLTILQGELELALRKTKTPDEYEEVLISALEEVARLTNVVETLLDLSRAESGQIRMNLIEDDLSKLLLSISEDAEILADSKGVNLKTNIDRNVVLPFDGARMHQAILNLVDNAIKYTNKGGSIYIELAKSDNKAEIIIRDTGIGIAPEELNHIFDRMYRVDKARSSNVSGVGLGLSIVKWIVKGHNGEINVESIVNKGSTFKIVLNTMNHNK